MVETIYNSIPGTPSEDWLPVPTSEAVARELVPILRDQPELVVHLVVCTPAGEERRVESVRCQALGFGASIQLGNAFFMKLDLCFSDRVLLRFCFVVASVGTPSCSTLAPGAVKVALGFPQPVCVSLEFPALVAG